MKRTQFLNLGKSRFFDFSIFQKMNPSFGVNSYAQNSYFKNNFSSIQHSHVDDLKGSSSHKLFAQPRDLNRLVEEPRKVRYIQPSNRICSPRKKLFQNGRENTKEAAPTIPQIDLSKPPKELYEFPQSERNLFRKPRDVMNKYSDIEGSHPYQSYNSSRSPNRYFEDNLLPNKPKLFKQPRSLDVVCDGSSTKPQININAPARSSNKLVEEAKKNLFSKPRDLNRLIPSDRRVYATRPIMEEDVEPPVPQRELFKQPREIMKYSDVEGSSPRPFYPAIRKNIQPDQMKGILY